MKRFELKKGFREPRFCMHSKASGTLKTACWIQTNQDQPRCSQLGSFSQPTCTCGPRLADGSLYSLLYNLH